MATKRKDPLNDDEPNKGGDVERVEQDERPDEDENPVIDLSEPDPADPPHQSRDDKKRERGRLREEAEADRAARAEADARAARTEQLLQQTLASQQEYFARQNGQTQRDPYQEGQERLKRERDLLTREVGLLQERAKRGENVSAEYQALTERVSDFDRRQAEFHADAAVARRQGAQPQTQQVHPILQHWQIREPEVMLNPQAARWVIMRVLAEVQAGAQDSPELTQQVIDQAKQRFGIGKPKRQQDPSLKTKLAGHGRGAGGGGGEAQFVMTKEHRRNAEALYANAKHPNGKAFTTQEKYEKYARGPGRKMLQGDKAAEE